MTDTITNLLKDLNIASDLMADTDTFPTGQAIMKDAAKTIAALQAENAKLREAADELAASATLLSYIHNDVIVDAKIRRNAAYGDRDLTCVRQNYLDAREAEKVRFTAALTAYRSTQSEAAALSGQDAEGET